MSVRLATGASPSVATDVGSSARDVAFRRSFFEKDKKSRSRTSHGRPSSSSAAAEGTRQLQERRGHELGAMIAAPSERHRQWYAEERALLRELVVLTMRHSDGALLRFVPSEEDQARQWNTRGHPAGGRYAPDVVAEGVRLHPRIGVLPEWTSGGRVAANGEGVEFRSELPMPLLGSGARDAISLCGEAGWLCGRVSAYVEAVLDDEDGVQCGTARALATRLDAELAEFHDRLSALERELPPLELGPASMIHDAPRPRYLTLRSLASRLNPIRDRLRTLAILADGVGACGLRGGKLLAAVLGHSLDGGTRHSELVRSIAADCSVPWYRLLSRWMTQGVLEDLHSEFFVKEITTDATGRQLATSSSGFYTWHKRYVLVEGLIPSCSCGGTMDIITVDLAREVLLVGKGINFIRHCLQDKDWEVVERDETSPADSGAAAFNHVCNFATLMDVGDDDDELKCVSTLNDAVLRSSARIHSHILDSLEKKHHMMQHLLALKHFLFLGQGDFVSSFVESLNQEFSGRTSIAGIYDHTLSALLEGSLRATTARFLPNFMLGNLGAKLMIDKHDSNRYWMGLPPMAKEVEMTPWRDNEASIQDPWDFIYLEYQINSPLDAIVHATAMKKYHQVFLFLFRLKRVEWMLNNSWRQSTALNHAILIETKAGGADAPAISEAAEHSSFLLRRISSTRQTMLHFISNLQNYLMFEVLEGGWEGLKASVRNARTVDDVIRAHDFYLNQIVDKTLLCIDEDGDSGNSKSLENLLRKLLSIALKFGKFQDHIFVNSLAGLDKAANIRRKVDERAEKGDWGRTTLDREEGRAFLYLADAKLFEFVERTANGFDTALSDLLKLMSKQIDEVDCNTSTDDDQEETHQVMKNHDALPFLLFRLDFSGYYARQANRKKRQSSE
jgi:gamma-tubulin complex component 3